MKQNLLVSVSFMTARLRSIPPVMLPWEGNSKKFDEISIDNTISSAATDSSDQTCQRNTFVVNIKLADIIEMNYASNASVNVQPVVQALDVVMRYVAAERWTAVGRSFFSLKTAFPLYGGKQLCSGFHHCRPKAAHDHRLRI